MTTVTAETLAAVAPMAGALAEEALATIEETTAPPAGEITHYDFDADFQTKIAALVLRDALFCQRTTGLIVPEYFQNVAEASLVNIGLTYFAKYRVIPDTVTLMKLVKDAVSAKTIREDLVEQVRTAMRSLLKADVSDRDYVIDEVAKFAQHQAMEQAILFAASEIEKRDADKFEKIAKRVRKALDVGALEDMGAYDYFEEIEHRTVERKLKAAGELKPTGITTGVPAFNNELYHRGWGRKELTVLMGGAKSGKTTALCEFAKNASLDGKNVLYVTLEVSAKIIAERIDANIGEALIMALEDRLHDVREKVLEAQKKAGKLVIHEYPTGSLRVSGLRRLIDRYKSLGTKFDLVCVDYADLMAPEIRTDEVRENNKSVYIDLRALAQEEDLALLTATQTNREGYKSAVAKAEHVAENFEKIRIADLVISINKTEEEAAMGEARLYFAASRNQRGGLTLRIKQDLERMQFLKHVIARE